jgi:hypothetical protein
MRDVVMVMGMGMGMVRYGAINNTDEGVEGAGGGESD